MKLTTVFVAIAAVMAGTAVTEAANTGNAGSWHDLTHKNAKFVKVYAEHEHTDLRTATPVMSRCKVTPNDFEHKHALFKMFGKFQKQDVQFQQLDYNHIGINCVDCTPQSLGNLYATKIGSWFTCKNQDPRPADWKPKF